MPESFPNGLQLTYPVEGDSPDIPRDIKRLAEQLNIPRGLPIVEQSGSIIAVAGEFLKATAALTVTTPNTPSMNEIFGVWANNHIVGVKAGSGAFYGGSVEGLGELKLSGYQHAIFQWDGHNWLIVSGGPTGVMWGAISAEGAIEVSTGPGFTVKKEAENTYAVTFETERSNAHYQVDINTEAIGIEKMVKTNKGFTVKLQESAKWSFMVINPYTLND